MKDYQRYGISVGQDYVPADGSKNTLTVRDVEKYADCGDVVVLDELRNEERRIDAFKLARARYRLADTSTAEERRALMPALHSGTATAEYQKRAAALLQVLLDAMQAMELDARRGRYVAEFSTWHRRTDELRDETRTWLCVRVKDDADLSCKALREMALDHAMTDPALR